MSQEFFPFNDAEDGVDQVEHSADKCENLKGCETLTEGKHLFGHQLSSRATAAVKTTTRLQSSAPVPTLATSAVARKGGGGL